MPSGGFLPTHGMRNTVIGSTWIAMIGRCLNPQHRQYGDYGGRGITVCKFLKESPNNLLSEIGERPSDFHSLDRIDNSSGYFCGSCADCKSMGVTKKNIRWATHLQQSNNKRTNAYVKIGAQTNTVADWGRLFGLSYETIHTRYRKGLRGSDLIAPFKDKNKYLIFKGKTISWTEFSKIAGIKKSALGMRIARGWTPDQLLLPKQKSRGGDFLK